MVIAIIGVLATMSITTIQGTIDDSRFQDTAERLKQVRVAMIGDANIIVNGARTSFGYLGDVGALPSTAQGINALLAVPGGVGTWTVSTAQKIGYGWNGPYLTSAQAGANFLNDSWGRAIIYSSTANPPTLTSYGADGAAGGTGTNSDIVVQLPPTFSTSTVYGFLTQNTSAYIGLAQVEIFYPNGSGALTSTMVTLNSGAAGGGQFTFANIPFGARSLAVYIPSKAAPTQTLGPSAITVDNARYVVPANLTDLGSTATSTACNDITNMTLTGTQTLAGGGRNLTFRLNIGVPANLNFMKVKSSRVATYNQLTTPGFLARCNNSPYLYPCPVNDDGTSAFVTPNQVIAAGNNQSFTIAFSASMAGSGVMTIEFWTNLGCEIFTTSAL